MLFSARVASVLLAASLASCAYVEATTTQYVGVPRFPPVEPAAVQVLPAEPAQRHDRLGEVLLDISLDPAPSVAEIEQRLREEAAKMGANAVYVIRDAIRPGDARKLIGIAIRFRA
jgi:hypothetical protein